MSLTQTLLGSVVSNCCFSRFSATGRACLESVVALNFLFCLHRIPSFFRILLIRQIPTLTPWSLSSCCNLSGPYVSRVLLWAALISTSSLPSSWARLEGSRLSHL